jgi:RNA polymerase sigma-70 factor (family 1)
MADYKGLSDNELLALLKEGNHAAFTQIYNIYWPLLYAHSRKMLRDDQEAMDIVQEIFTALWNKSNAIELNFSLRAYLYAAVRNHTINHINKSKLKDKYITSLADLMEKGASVTDEQVIFADFTSRIEKEVANLPERMRVIFEMSRNQGLSHKEIADELDITDHAVKKSINRTLKVLRAQISSVLLSLLF